MQNKDQELEEVHMLVPFLKNVGALIFICLIISIFFL
jgi:uncharacterized membrane protein